MSERGEVLKKAIKVINGERQDHYGSPEDSFSLIASYWNIYLKSKVETELKRREIKGEYVADLTSEDATMMMVLFKIAREANQHKFDNVVDAAGYLGIYGDMFNAESNASEQSTEHCDPLQNPELDEVGE